MTDFSAFLADSWVSVCGAVGAAIVLFRMADLTASPPVARRFRACLWVIIVVMTARVGNWAEWGWLFNAATYASAALLPLMALFVAEGMMRMHAPRWLKRFCGWGAVVLVLLALLPTTWMEYTHLLGLLLFQLAGLAGVAVMVLRRDQSLLSDAENQSLNRIMLSFLLILPLLATDYYGPVVPVAPVRLGGIAVLGLCLLTININRPSLSQRRIIGSMAGLFAVTICLTALVAVMADATGPTALRIGVVLLATVMLLATWQAARALEIEDRYAIMLREMARLGGTGPGAAVQMIQRGAGVPDALVLEGHDFSDFDTTALRLAFATKPVRTAIADTSDEQLAWLFSRFEASHALCILDDPLTVVVFNNPALTASNGDDFGLAALQRVAAQTAGATA